MTEHTEYDSKKTLEYLCAEFSFLKDSGFTISKKSNTFADKIQIVSKERLIAFEIYFELREAEICMNIICLENKYIPTNEDLIGEKYKFYRKNFNELNANGMKNNIGNFIKVNSNHELFEEISILSKKLKKFICEYPPSKYLYFPELS